MVPDVAKAGTSFKGAFAYYLHDKRGPGLDGSTAERVAWTETRNLASDDPGFAQSVMIATARQSDALKEAAGVKATGRKSNAHVYAFALAWHPDEAGKLDRDEMRRTADAALKAIAADHLQAVIVCHQDTAHPHVHVIVNRVDPATGKLHSTSNDYKKLSAWARDYERERGQIVTPGRVKEKAPERQQEAPVPVPQVAPAKQPEAPTPSSGPIVATGRDQDDERANFSGHNQLKPPAPAPPQVKSPAAVLVDLQAAQKARHAQEWRELAAVNRDRRGAVYAERIDFKAMAAAHRTATRPRWSELGKMQAAERRAFNDREKQLAGIVRNAIDAVRGQQIRGVGDDRGFLSMAFAFTLNTQARRAAFEARQQDIKAQFSATQDAALRGRFSLAKMEQALKLDAVRKTYTADRAALVTRQDLEKAQIREGWRQLYAERERRAELDRHRGRSAERVAHRGGQNYRQGRRLDRAIPPAPIVDQAKPPGPTKPRVSIRADFRPAVQHQPEPQPMNRDFDHASRLPPANQPAAPTREVSLTVPLPAPSPAGEVPAVHRRVQEVPQLDRAAEWGKTAEGRRVIAQQAEKVAPANIRPAAAEVFRPAAGVPAAATPAEPAKPKAGDYFAMAKAEITQRREQPAPSRDRLRDNDFERDR